MKGIRIACLYSYGCERATSLGINNQLFEYIQNRNLNLEKKDLIVSMVKKLLSYPGYQKISALTKRGNCFAEKVVKGYWLSDKNLERVDLTHNFATLEKFKAISADQHLPAWIVKKMLDCAISFGEVIKVDREKAEVSNRRLLFKEGEVVLGKETREVDTKFVDSLKEGDLVSIHLGIAREKISKVQAKTLENMTLKALGVFHIA